MEETLTTQENGTVQTPKRGRPKGSVAKTAGRPKKTADPMTAAAHAAVEAAAYKNIQRVILKLWETAGTSPMEQQIFMREANRALKESDAARERARTLLGQV